VAYVDGLIVLTAAEDQPVVGKQLGTIISLDVVGILGGGLTDPFEVLEDGRIDGPHQVRKGDEFHFPVMGERETGFGRDRVVEGDIPV
jgi:hypothetical protein